MSIKLVIGCCSYLFGEGLKKLLKDDRDINIIGIFDEGIDLEEIVKLKPDVILADFNIFSDLPENFAINDQLKIILIGGRTWPSSLIGDKQIVELFSKGLVGILPPGADSVILKKALKAVYQGELWIDHKTVKNFLFSRISPENKVSLTRKEEEIASLICQGYRNKEIAQKLDINEQTVKSHCNRIYKKIGVSDRLQLALYCYKIWPGYYMPNVLKQKNKT